MEKLLLLLLFMSLYFTSCGGDDNDQFKEEITKNELIGSWQYVNKDGTSGNFLNFKEDMGTYIIYKNSTNIFSDWFKYNISGLNITFNYNKNGTKVYNIYKVGENKISFDNQILTRK